MVAECRGSHLQTPEDSREHPGYQGRVQQPDGNQCGLTLVKVLFSSNDQ